MSERNEKTRRQAILAAAEALAERSGAEMGHSRQVTALALRLFEELRPLHGLGGPERFYLRSAGLLHDIGIPAGTKGHHKTAMRMILDDTTVPLKPRERLIVAAVARYHRKALPKLRHVPYGELDEADRRIVCVLAGLLRVADGLDRTHTDAVTDVSCEVSADELVVRCLAAAPAEAERLVAQDKSDLLAAVLDRPVRIEPAPPRKAGQ